MPPDAIVKINNNNIIIITKFGWLEVCEAAVRDDGCIETSTLLPCPFSGFQIPNASPHEFSSSSVVPPADD